MNNVYYLGVLQIFTLFLTHTYTSILYRSSLLDYHSCIEYMSLTSTVECTSVRPGFTLLTGLCWSIVASIFGRTLGLYSLK